MESIVIIVFLVGYLAITLEHNLKIDKLIPALAMMAKTQRIRISMVTDLDTDLCRSIGVDTIDAAQAAERVRHHRGRLAVIPNASLLVRS